MPAIARMACSYRSAAAFSITQERSAQIAYRRISTDFSSV